MNILFFDATNEWIIIETYQITNSIKSVYNWRGFYPRESSFRLVKEIQHGLLKSDFQKPDLIITCKGPGSFTGLRICVSTARNLAQIWDVPVIGLNSIELYSEYYFEKDKIPAIVLMESGQRKFFTGKYDNLGFDGCYDITIENLDNTFPSYEKSCKLYSNSRFISNSFDMNLDIPNGQIAVSKISKIQFSKEIHNYKNLHPDYMRETYAKEKKK